MSGPWRKSGFTLLELVLVLVIIGTVLATAAPSLRGWNRGSRLRDLASGFLATAQWARSQAVATGQVHRLCIDVSTGTYWVMTQEGEEFVSVESGPGRPTLLPEGFRIELKTNGAGSMDAIEFYPTGRTQPAVVRILSDQNDLAEIECLSPAEQFRLVVPAGRSG